MPRKPKTPAPAPVTDDDTATLAEMWEKCEPGQRVSHGVYSIYKTQDGGMHVSYRADGTDEDAHLPIPGPLMQMMLAGAEGKGPMGRIRAMAMARAGR
jgi:hypothetical protein